eukprot:CAMPEP_0184685008 /NCGR_PEP_ID=MMETSP0312-20130426/17363_1 /TAXON_ID=31354 /ORGANISM="Compsopogon coeruleus, Strain SAG 36.94" /LENGTH=401 /DNA_ID=CAMNT_0027138699 /DNA_START=101 /DNA_END=1305 /DNA_ORIENTATION=-
MVESEWWVTLGYTGDNDKEEEDMGPGNPRPLRVVGRDVIGWIRDLRDKTLEMPRWRRLQLINDRLLLNVVEKKRFDTVAVLQGLRKHNLGPDVVMITILIDAWSRKGDFREAMRCFRSMHNLGIMPNQISYNAILAASARCKKPSTGLVFYEEMLDKGFIPTSHTYSSYIDCLTRLGRVEQAESILTDQPSAETVFAYTLVIAAYSRQLMIFDALRLLKRMYEKGLTPNEKTLTVLIRALGRAKEANLAIKLFNQELRLHPDRVLDDRLFAAMVAACAATGKLQEALFIYRIMKRKKLVASVTVHNGLIHACGQAGAVQRAFIIYRYMQSSTVTPNESTFIALANALLRSNIRDSRTHHILAELQRYSESPRSLAARKTRALQRLLQSSHPPILNQSLSKL